eukprot:Polyplicarium_translucidae@DN2324_c0_g1_i2.p1
MSTESEPSSRESGGRRCYAGLNLYFARQVEREFAIEPRRCVCIPRCLGPEVGAVVVKTVDEMREDLADLVTRESLVINTVLLPPGMSMDDPRLQCATTVSSMSYTQDVGMLPELPEASFDADVEGKLIPPFRGLRKGHTQRVQVIPDEDLALALVPASIDLLTEDFSLDEE